MKSMFTLQEVGEMLDMSKTEIEAEIEDGYLNYSFIEGQKKITLYDLEKYMGAEQAEKITREYVSAENG